MIPKESFGGFAKWSFGFTERILFEVILLLFELHKNRKTRKRCILQDDVTLWD